MQRPIHKGLHTHIGTFWSFFLHICGCFKKSYREGALESLYREEIFKAPTQKGLCTHIHTFQSFFPTDTGVLHKTSAEETFCKAPIQKELHTHTHKCTFWLFFLGTWGCRCKFFILFYIQYNYTYSLCCHNKNYFKHRQVFAIQKPTWLHQV